MATSNQVPFEQMPYQCFQEARKILNQDREEKISKIIEQTEKIKRIEAADASTFRGGEEYKQRRIDSLRKEIEELKILADINDPAVKRRFEDGMGMCLRLELNMGSDRTTNNAAVGDMSKPIYRYLANRKWRSMDYKIIVQRINQFHIVPDILPKFDPAMDVKMSFRGYKTAPGTILDSRITEVPPTLNMQVFDKGQRFLTIAVMDADVPNVETDGFSRRCHFLATNVPWGPTDTQLPLRYIGGGRTPGDLAVPWLPPFAQKGSPYHRLNIWVMEQKPGEKLDTDKLKELYDGAEGRTRFSVKGIRDKFGVTPVGFSLFRTVWDENTAGVMERHGIPGADIEFKRPRVQSLKPHRARKGLEAKRQKPKYKSLWKYTKRIKNF